MDEIGRFEEVCGELDEFVSFQDSAEKSWYKFNSDLKIVPDLQNGLKRLMPLSACSSVVGGLKAVRMLRVYAHNENKADAKLIVDKCSAKWSK
jgi:hypothetical protein